MDVSGDAWAGCAIGVGGSEGSQQAGPGTHIHLGDANVVAISCQKNGDDDATLTLTLRRDGDVVQQVSTSDAYGTASVSGI